MQLLTDNGATLLSGTAVTKFKTAFILPRARIHMQCNLNTKDCLHELLHGNISAIYKLLLKINVTLPVHQLKLNTAN